MSRQFQIAGQTLVAVYGYTVSDSFAIPTPTSAFQLGLAVDSIQVTVNIHSKHLTADPFGGPPDVDVPVDEQVFGADASITMNLVHFDAGVLSSVVGLSLPRVAGSVPISTAFSATEGILGTPGQRRGGAGQTPFSFIGLGLVTPVTNNAPFFFPFAYLRDEPIQYPLGAEKTITTLRWRALAYLPDPWNGGFGGLGAVLYSRTLPAVVIPPNPT